MASSALLSMRFLPLQKVPRRRRRFLRLKGQPVVKTANNNVIINLLLIFHWPDGVREIVGGILRTHHRRSPCNYLLRVLGHKGRK